MLRMPPRLLYNLHTKDMFLLELCSPIAGFTFKGHWLSRVWSTSAERALLGFDHRSARIHSTLLLLVSAAVCSFSVILPFSPGCQSKPSLMSLFSPHPLYRILCSLGCFLLLPNSSVNGCFLSLVLSSALWLMKITVFIYTLSSRSLRFGRVNVNSSFSPMEIRV